MSLRASRNGVAARVLHDTAPASNPAFSDWTDPRDVLLARRRSPNARDNGKMTERTMILATMSDSDDDVPLGQRMPELVKKMAPRRDDSDSDDDLPLGARMQSKPKPKPSASKPKPKKRKVESDSDDEPIGSLIKKSGGSKPKPSKPRSSGARKKAKTGSRTASTKGKKMWKTLEHNGCLLYTSPSPRDS